MGRGVPPSRLTGKAAFQAAARHTTPPHPQTARKTSTSKIPLALGVGMWHTIFVLPLKGEITDYPRGSDGEQP